MSIDSNRVGQLFYCPSVGITAQVQRSVPKPQTYTIEQNNLSSASSSSTSSPIPSSMAPLILIRPPSRSNLPPQAPNSIPIASTGTVKMLNITITRKRLKVTAGANELPISILKPIAHSIGPVGGKVRKLDVVPPLPAKIPIQTVLVKSPTDTSLAIQCPEPSPSTLTNPIPPTQSSVIPHDEKAPSPDPVSPSTQSQPSPPTALITVMPEIAELCAYCDTYFYTFNSLTLHLLTTHYATPVSNVKVCSICKIVYRDYSEYAFHCLHSHSSLPPTGIEMECLVTVASPVNPIYRKCLICNRTFSSTRAIMIHFAEHLGPSCAYQCRFCLNLVNDLWPLVVHLRRTHLVKFKYPTKSRNQETDESQVSTCPTSPTKPAPVAVAVASTTPSTSKSSTS